MAPELTDLEEARRIVLDSCEPLPPEPVNLERSLGRVLAEDVLSEIAIPSFDNSAMDGFAVRAADTADAAPDAPARLTVIGESRAGHPADRAVDSGSAIRISTGAMVPEGADAVLRREDATELDGSIESERRLEPGADIRRAGEDIRPGDTVLTRGSALGPAELGVLASVGHDQVRCHRRARLALIVTGDELVDPAQTLRPGQIRDTNGITLASLAELAGADVTTVMRVRDDRAATRASLAGAIRSDVAVISGGVSVGPHDHVRPSLDALGAEQLFWGVAVRPGKPTWFGLSDGGPRHGGGLIFGLPGNPVSAVVIFLLLVRPALRALAGLDPLAARATAILDEPYEKSRGRTHAVRVCLQLADDGWHATLTRPEQASHILTSMVGADALAIVPADSEGVAVGQSVEVELI